MNMNYLLTCPVLSSIIVMVIAGEGQFGLEFLIDEITGEFRDEIN